MSTPADFRLDLAPISVTLQYYTVKVTVYYPWVVALFSRYNSWRTEMFADNGELVIVEPKKKSEKFRFPPSQKLAVFWLVALLPFILITVKCENAKQGDVINLIFENATNKTFFEHGVPVITNRSKTLFTFSQSSIQFIPRLQDLGLEPHSTDNIYVFAKNLNCTKLQLYATEEFPNNQHYEIDVQKLTITKCENDSDCRDLRGCINQTISHNDTSVDDQEAIYVSWHEQNQTKKIVAQYKNHKIFCQDTTNPWSIKKVLMYNPCGEEQNLTQNITPFSYSFKYTQNPERLVSNKFNISKNQSLYLQISQCVTCKIILEMHCNRNFSRNVTLDFKNNSSQTWEEVNLKGPDTENNVCNLIIIPSVDGQANDKFWALTSTTLLEMQNIFEPSNNKNGSTNIKFDYLVITVFIIVYRTFADGI